MWKQKLVMAAWLLSLPLLFAVQARAEATLYSGGFIYARAGLESPEALVVRDGNFAYAGKLEEALGVCGSKCQRVDLAGRMLAPSFFDAHAHPNLGVIFDLRDLPYRDKLPTPAEYVEHIRQYLLQHPETRVLRGVGWDNAAFRQGPPDKALLDQVSRDIPIFLRSSDQHSAWVNSKALELGGIDRHTPNPSGGLIERDAGGQPGGTLRDGASNFIEAALPPLSVDENKALILKFQDMAHSLGITAYMCAMVMPRSTLYTAYRELLAEGRLKTYTQLAFMMTPDTYQDALAWLAQEVADYEATRSGDLLGFRLAKFFMDGTIIGQSAYLLEDYAARPGYRGESQWPPDVLQAAFQLCEQQGIRIHVHVIGDAAAQLALDKLETLTRPNRHALTHLEVIRPEDIARFKASGLIATLNPYWFCKSLVWKDVELAHLGPERAERMLPARAFLDAGVPVAAASDYPVTAVPNPLIGMEMAVSRTLIAAWRDGRSAEACMLNPGQALAPEQALDAFTFTAAYAYGLEQLTGSIEQGKSADFVVLDRNILTGPSSEARVLETWFRGQLVYQAR